MFSISDKIKKIALTSRKAVYYRRVRQNSAVTKKRGVLKRVTNNLKSIVAHTRIFCRGGYSLYLYMTRIAIDVRGIILAPIYSIK
jgi:hypothetical protein